MMESSQHHPGRARAVSLWHRAIAWGLVGLLTACSATQPLPTVDTQQELPQNVYEYVLVVREVSGGRLEHAWRPAADWDWALKELRSSTGSEAGRIVQVSRRPRDCDQEQIDCHRDCMRRKPPYPRERKSHNHIQYCNEKCLQEYMDCLELQKRQPLGFPELSRALDWLRENRTEVLVGSIIIIAGIAFITISAGAGVVVLAPVVLLASSTVPGAPYCSGG
jgi:hypothetical protein